MVVDKLERQIRSGKEASVARKRGAQSAGQFAAAAPAEEKVENEE
jgi:hypothetical protein